MRTDGIAYDRTTMKRCRKVMDAAKDGCLIDIHSGNNFAPQYGMVSPALQYMMLMPCARRSSLAGSLLFCKPNKLIAESRHPSFCRNAPRRVGDADHV